MPRKVLRLAITGVERARSPTPPPPPPAREPTPPPVKDKIESLEIDIRRRYEKPEFAIETY
jgi:hypothetical protein